MIINRNNYESWLLDYFEGNLSPEQIAAVDEFLVENPDIKSEFNDFAIIEITEDKGSSLSPKFIGKLKRPVILTVKRINSENYEDWFISFYEGLLSDEEKDNLTLFLEQNPDYQAEFETYGTLSLEADTKIVYPAKSSLKKALIIPLYQKIGVIATIAAASILFFLVLKPFTESTVSKEQISMLQTRPFVITTNAPVLEMIPNSSTAIHFEENSDVIVEIIKPVVPPTSTERINTMPSLRPVPLAITNNLKLIEPRNEYTILAEYIRMQEEMKTASLTNQEDDAEDATLLTKVIKGLSKDLGEDSNDKLSFLSVLEFGITQYHRITNKPVTVEKEISPDGQTNAYHIATENFEISRKKKPDEM